MKYTPTIAIIGESGFRPVRASQLQQAGIQCITVRQEPRGTAAVLSTRAAAKGSQCDHGARSNFTAVAILRAEVACWQAAGVYRGVAAATGGFRRRGRTPA